MATYASDTGGGGDFAPVPEGAHPAICDMFVDLGLQETTGKFAGKVQGVVVQIKNETFLSAGRPAILSSSGNLT